MTTAKELLEEYNKLASQIGAMKLRAWKGSKKDLEDRLEGFRRQAKNIHPQVTEKKVVENKSVKRESNTLSVVGVCEELGMSPKVARAKLRRKGLKANEGRWPTFERGSDEHKEMINLLKEKKSDE